MPNPSGGTMTGNADNGFARISYADVAQNSTISVTVAGNVSRAEYKKAITITANTNTSGKVVFRENNRKIAGCINKIVLSTSVTCNWKPSIRGNVVLSASFAPTSLSYLSSISAPVSITIVARTTPR